MQTRCEVEYGLTICLDSLVSTPVVEVFSTSAIGPFEVGYPVILQLPGEQEASSYLILKRSILLKISGPDKIKQEHVLVVKKVDPPQPEEGVKKPLIWYEGQAD